MLGVSSVVMLLHQLGNGVQKWNTLSWSTDSFMSAKLMCLYSGAFLLTIIGIFNNGAL